MATKKAASNVKKSTTPPTSKKHATTKVTTVKAVETRPTHRNVSAASTGSRRFGLMRTPLIAALIAEFIGTFFFAAAFLSVQGQPLYVFFAFIGVVLITGTLSGGYANPALVIGSWITKRMSGIRALAYVVAQVLGAMLALVVLNSFVNSVATTDPTQMGSAAPTLFTALALPESNLWLILVTEVIGMIIFGFAMANALREKLDRTAAAFTAGLGLLLGYVTAYSAAAVLGATTILNPAVAISMQAIDFSSVWPIAIYVLGPILGAVIGFVLYDYLRKAENEVIA